MSDGGLLLHTVKESYLLFIGRFPPGCCVSQLISIIVAQPRRMAVVKRWVSGETDESSSKTLLEFDPVRSETLHILKLMGLK